MRRARALFGDALRQHRLGASAGGGTGQDSASGPPTALRATTALPARVSEKIEGLRSPAPAMRDPARHPRAAAIEPVRVPVRRAVLARFAARRALPQSDVPWCAIICHRLGGQ